MTHPQNEILAAKVEMYLWQQGIEITAEQRQWFETYFAEMLSGAYV